MGVHSSRQQPSSVGALGLGLSLQNIIDAFKFNTAQSILCSRFCLYGVLCFRENYSQLLKIGDFDVGNTNEIASHRSVADSLYFIAY